MERIYLDHNSTTPIDPLVARAIYDCQLEEFVNPASQHLSGQAARRKLESTRHSILEMVGANTTGMRSDRLLITSGGTESNNLAVFGFAGSKPCRIVVSSVEHPSVFGPAERLDQLGFDIVSIPVDKHGVMLVNELEKLVTVDTRLVSVMLANNETGVIQPIAEVSRICRERNVPIHCDATQAVGKIPVDFAGLGVDAMTFSAHKFYGPRGIGALVCKADWQLEPVLYGGFQQMGSRPGTEDVSLAVGMETALRQFHNQPDRYQDVKIRKDRLETALADQFGAVVNGAKANRLPHTLNVSIPGIDRQAFLMAADLAGLDISTGSACASGSSEPSPVLIAMNLPGDVIGGSIRISLGVGNTDAEIEETIKRIRGVLSQIQAQK